jgi:hypothetical protein
MKRRVENDGQWYIAALVVRIRVAGDRRTVTHVNWCLVRARSGEEAYERALALGRKRDYTDVNPAGKRVTFKFLGLRQLLPIYDPLEDGEEIMFDEYVSANGVHARAKPRKRAELAVFAPRKKRRGPDYTSAEIVAEVTRRMADAAKSE